MLKTASPTKKSALDSMLETMEEYTQQLESKVSPTKNVTLLLACLESVYSLIWDAHEIWGQDEGKPLALL